MTAQELADELYLASTWRDDAHRTMAKSAAMLLQQAEQIKKLKTNLSEETKNVKSFLLTIQSLEIERDALKADAERWKTIKPHFYFDNEGGHGFWNCSISSESWTVDGIIPDAAIDAMKGES